MQDGWSLHLSRFKSGLPYMTEPNFDEAAADLLRDIGAYASLQPKVKARVAERLKEMWRSGSEASEVAIREHRERVVGSPVPDPF